MTQSFADPGAPTGGGGATRTATVNLNANVAGYTQGMNEAAQSTGALASGIDAVSARMSNLNKWAGKKLFHFAAADFAVLAGATTDAALFEKQLSTLAATATVTGTSMNGIKNGIETAFTKFPVARSAVIDLTEAITNLGVTSGRDIASLTQTFIKLGAATGEPMSQLAGGLVQLSRLMGNTGATQIGNYANALLTVSKNAGVSASGVLSFAQAIAPIARQAGISEGAVIGISTAFTKAGADGLIAANTFNSMVSDITQATATGSPDLAKYANLLGVSVEKFKKMDKTNAMVDILQAITKEGPQSLAILSSLGIASTRAQAAIAAVTQSGDLRAQVNSAMGAQGNQDNLTKGAKSAMGGLADSMVNVRNEFTQFGTEIGSTFLKPLTLVSNLVVRVTKDLNALYKPFAPIIAGISAIAGAAAGIGSIAMTAAGAIGAYALIRNVRNSRAMGALREGFNPMAPNAMRAGGAMDRYTMPVGTPGRMGWFQRRLYETGMGGRQLAGFVGGRNADGERSPWTRASTIRNALIAAPIRGMRYLSRANEQFLRGEMPTPGSQLPWRDRLNAFAKSVEGRHPLEVVGRETQQLAGQMGRTGLATGAAGAQLSGRLLQGAWRLMGPSVLGALVGGATGLPAGRRLTNAGINRLPTGSIKDEAANTRAELTRLGTAFKAAGTGMLGVRGGFKEVGVASGRVSQALLRLSGNLLGTGIGETVKGLGKGIGGVFKGLGAVGGYAMRAAFSLPGMVAMMGMTKIAGMADAKQHEGDVDKFLNPIQKYNDMLGTTTTNLANFNAKLIEGSGAVSPVTTMAQAATVTADDQTNAPNKAKNKVFGDVRGEFKKGSVAQGLASALAAMPITDAKQLQAAKEDMFAGGASQQEVLDAMKIYMKAGGPNKVSGVQDAAYNWKNLGMAAASTEGVGTNWGGDMSKSVKGGHILGTLISGIDSQRISDEQTKGGAYAQQKALQNYAIGLSPLVGNISTGSKNQRTTSGKALSEVLSKITGGSQDKYLEFLMAHYGDGGGTEAGQQKFLIRALGATKEGKRWENALTSKSVGGTLDMSQMNSRLVDMSNTADGASFNGLLRRTGGMMGTFAAKDATVQSAIGGQQANTGVVNQSVEKLLKQAERMGGGLAGAATELSKFQGAIGDSTGVLYRQVTAAQALAVQQASYRAPFQSRAKNFNQTVTDFQTATETYYTTPVAKRTDDQKSFMQSRKDAYEQSLAEQQSYLQSMYQTAKSYGTQMTRAEEDENTQRVRMQAAFHLQMANAQHDFLLQRNRTEADHDTALRNQVASSAQGIYNPYLRVQADYTDSAETLLENLKDQNQRIAAQKATIDKLHKEGLSTSTIQTLDLANPANAQQTASLANLTPAQIREMNREADKRKAATKNLTQSPYNLAFSQEEADFHKSMDRAQQDYDRSVSLANTAQELALTNMATDYGRTVKRAGEDLTTAMTEVTGHFGSMYNKTMAQVAASVEKFSPRAAAQMRKDLGGLVAQFPWLKTGDATSNDGRYALPGTKNNPLTGAGTIGRNAKGQVGEYTADGKFHKISGPLPAGPLPVIASPTSVPPPVYTQNAAGGIATSAHVGVFGEAGPEALIPLNQRGQDFMAGLIAKAMGQSMTMTGGRTAVSQSSITDASTNFTGAVTVVSNDTMAFEREMRAKARLKRLSSPARH